jgi:hypothetical protein
MAEVRVEPYTPRGSPAALPLLVGHSLSSDLEGQRLVSVVQ